MTTWIDSHHDMLNRIKGFLDRQEGQALYQLACEAGRRGPCLEVGSYCGKSTVYIGAACRENNSVLYSIDDHRGSEEQQPAKAILTRTFSTIRHFRSTPSEPLDRRFQTPTWRKPWCPWSADPMWPPAAGPCRWLWFSSTADMPPKP